MNTFWVFLLARFAFHEGSILQNVAATVSALSTDKCQSHPHKDQNYAGGGSSGFLPGTTTEVEVLKAGSKVVVGR